MKLFNNDLYLNIDGQQIPIGTGVNAFQTPTFQKLVGEFLVVKTKEEADEINNNCPLSRYAIYVGQDADEIEKHYQANFLLVKHYEDVNNVEWVESVLLPSLFMAGYTRYEIEQEEDKNRIIDYLYELHY